MLRRMSFRTGQPGVRPQAAPRLCHVPLPIFPMGGGIGLLFAYASVSGPISALLGLGSSGSVIVALIASEGQRSVEGVFGGCGRGEVVFWGVNLGEGREVLVWC